MTTSRVGAPASEEVDDAPRCAVCGYDLRGLAVPRCPECGLAFDPHVRPRAAVPWLARREAGAWRAYWGTVALVLLRPAVFGREVRRPVEVSLSDANRFRWVTMAVATGSAIATVIAILAETGVHAGAIAIAIPFMVITPAVCFLWIAAMPIELLVFVDASFATVLRFGRLQHFTCAGLATAPLVPASILFDYWVGPLVDLPYTTPFALVIVPFAWWAGNVAYHYFGGRFPLRRVVIYAIVLPMMWCFWAAATAALMVPFFILGGILMNL